MTDNVWLKVKWVGVDKDQPIGTIIIELPDGQLTRTHFSKVNYSGEKQHPIIIANPETLDWDKERYVLIPIDDYSPVNEEKEAEEKTGTFLSGMAILATFVALWMAWRARM